MLGRLEEEASRSGATGRAVKESAGNDNWRIEGVVRDGAMALVKKLYWMETELQLAEPLANWCVTCNSIKPSIPVWLVFLVEHGFFMSKTGFRMLEKIIFDDQFCALTFSLTFTNNQNWQWAFYPVCITLCGLQIGAPVLYAISFLYCYLDCVYLVMQGLSIQTLLGSIFLMRRLSQ